jgi:hypothetical protein
MRGEIVEMCCGEFHQFPIVLHRPRASAMLADHRVVSQAVPVDRRRRLIAGIAVTAREVFVFHVRECHSNRPPEMN